MKNSIQKFLYDWIGSLIILPFIIYFLSNVGKFHFIDYLNLLIHEGGHGIFKIFGGFIYTLGGTLMQIIIPSLFVFYYLINKKKFLTQIFLLWLGENFINISIYIKDAQTQKLPLLGGKKVYHDWNFILSKINLLEYDQQIGNVFLFISILIFLVAIFIPLIREKEKVNLNLNI